MDYPTHCAELSIEGERFVSRMSGADPATAVPTCPGWSVVELCAHVAYVHRWAEALVARRSAQRLSRRDLGLTAVSAEPLALVEGLATLSATLARSDPDAPMWAWGADQHVRFWARRMLHETLIHRVDLECALGLDHEIGAAVALDAIDEFLANLGPARAFSPGLAELVGEGETLEFASREGRRWSVALEPEGFTLTSSTRPPDAVLEGPASELLLVLYRRRALAESACGVVGRQDLVERWLSHSALE